MSLESKSKELKELVAIYDTRWFLGNLGSLMKAIADNKADDQLGQLSSPMRQLYYLGGLAMSSDPEKSVQIQYSNEEWSKIVKLLNEIELEYDKIFFPQEGETINEEWKRVRQVAMPSFLSYFNQGPLNYEEQTINWIDGLYTKLDSIIEDETGLKTIHFLKFYENLDALIQKNFQGFTPNGTLRPDWEVYTNMPVVPADHMPDFMMELFEERKPLMTYVADPGIINRFYPKELVSQDLTLDQVKTILTYLISTRTASNFIYYTESKPGNPLYDKPIVELGDDLFQVFEIKQVLHAIENVLENICSNTTETTTKLIEKKGKLLEDKILDIFKKLLGPDIEIYTSYYIDGCEQDILILWKKYAFIIEAKGYKLNEPFRDPERAFNRIKKDFKSSIGYGYKQTKRVEDKFVNQEPLKIEDKNGNVVEEIDTTKYKGGDFSIIVNLKSFGQIQNDLSVLLEISNDDCFPWVVKLDDLEVFILTLIAQKRKPIHFVNFLLMREELHGKLFCSDELEVCGGFLVNKINSGIVARSETILTAPDLATIFDKQYIKGMGFDNEKYITEKRSGKYIFWG
ncbi:NERD domain-containing protein [Fulvivirga sp.]|uniref:NERD domain-containing protein n=1 Tax=Fulvivirga sp. TaxID=1931237 RepID=UPI0032F06C7F